MSIKKRKEKKKEEEEEEEGGRQAGRQVINWLFEIRNIKIWDHN